jgi:RHS repeat-associated protein
LKKFYYSREGLAGGSYWVYEYDRLGQVVRGRRYWSDGTPVAGQQFEYGFDDIGNRKVSRRGGDGNGWNLRESLYSANLLNQYSQRTVPGYVDILGVAFATNLVYVNSQIANRKGEYFWKELSMNNTTGSVWQPVTVTATGLTTVTGNVFVARTPEVFSYDLDGNMTSDGRWNYTWDAENRLIMVESRPDTPSGSWRRIEWTYDALGRRIQQVTLIWTNNAWFVVENLKFVSDPMLFGRHIVELNATNNALVRSYVWGLDLSGTMDGAGGVGGLAWVTLHTASGSASGTHFVCYDGNGNIVSLVSAATGDITARYEYGPFGEPIRISGPAAILNPFRFSTKRTDNTTDFVLYEYRIYSLSTGCWPNRDRINETSFKVLESKRRGLFYNDDEKNLYGFVRNNPVSRIDFLGFYSAIVGKCEVVVLYGHGSSSRLHEFKFADCSAGHFVGCESKATNDKIPSENQIPGAPSTEEELYSGPRNRDDPDHSFDLFMDKTWEAAKNKAKAICSKKDCCCRSVTVRTELAGSAWHPDNWAFPGTKSETIKCYVK